MGFSELTTEKQVEMCPYRERAVGGSVVQHAQLMLEVHSTITSSTRCYKNHMRSESPLTYEGPAAVQCYGNREVCIRSKTRQSQKIKM